MSDDAAKLWFLVAVFVACPALGGAVTIHKKLKNRNNKEIRALLHQANQDKQEAIKLQVRDSVDEAQEATQAATNTQLAINKATSDLAKWRHTNKEPLERYASKIKALTPNGDTLLLDERLSLPDLIERVVRDAVGKRKGFQGMKVSRGTKGFEVTLTFDKSLEWSDKTAIMEGIRQIKKTIDPLWISDLKFTKKDGKPVTTGRLDGLTDGRLTAIMSAYYTTKSVRLPDPNIVGRRNHPEAAWQIKNGTGRHIAISYFGPEQGTINLVPKQTKEIKFKPGQYFISVKATDTGSHVTPYSGNTNYKGGYLYSSEWIIRTSYGPNIPGLPYRPGRRR